MVAKIANLLLLGVFPIAWMAPLLRAENPWLLISEEITILSAVLELYETDRFLAIVLAVFAFLVPYAKTLALVYAQFSETETARRMMPFLEVMARFSMTDVFLVAMYVVVYRGLGEIVTEWGLYLFTAAVLVSVWSSWATHRRLRREIRIAAQARGAAGSSPPADARMEEQSVG